MTIFNINYQIYNRENLLVLSIENEEYSNMILFDNSIQDYINNNNVNKEFSICLKDLRQDLIVAFCLLKTEDNGIENSVKIEALGFCDEFTKERISNQTLSQSCFGGNYDSVWYQTDNAEILPLILTQGFNDREENIKIRIFNHN